MSCARYREKLGQALYGAEDDGLKDVHMLTCPQTGWSPTLKYGFLATTPAPVAATPPHEEGNKRVQLDLQNHRQYERPLGRLFIEELLQILSDFFFDHSPIATFFYCGVSNRIRQHLLTFRKQPLFLDESDSTK